LVSAPLDTGQGDLPHPYHGLSAGYGVLRRLVGGGTDARDDVSAYGGAWPLNGYHR
jgi:hypothetical protein